MFKKYKQRIFIITSIIATFILLSMGYSFDNKYNTKGPYGKNGFIKISENDLNNKLIFLIDGWKFYEGFHTPKTINSAILNRETFIGEYSRYKKELNTGTYVLNINYHGQKKSVSLFFPELAKDYQIYFDDVLLSQGSYNANTSFILTPGTHKLLVTIEKGDHYYSGMYYPPILGETTALTFQQNLRNILYTLIIGFSFSIGVFSLSLYGKQKNKLYFSYAFTCFFFATYCSYHLIHVLKLPLEDISYYIEELSLYLLLYYTFKIVAIASNLEDKRIYRKYLVKVTIFLSILCFLIFLFIPINSFFINIHSNLHTLYRLYVCICLLSMSIYGFYKDRKDAKYVLLGSLIFSIGLLCNIFDTNLFEPIFTFWQLEWCGFIMILLFANLIFKKYNRIYKENEAFSNKLEELVADKTQKINLLLKERKEFYINTIHDLKSPLSISNSYLDFLKKEDITHSHYEYLQTIQTQLDDVFEKIILLNTFSTIDNYVEFSNLSINHILDEIHKEYEQDCDAIGVHLIIHHLLDDCSIYIQKEKLFIVLKSLIYNTLDLSSLNDYIRISAYQENDHVYLLFEDNTEKTSDEDIEKLTKPYNYPENSSQDNKITIFMIRNILYEMNAEIESVNSNKCNHYRIKFNIGKKS